MQRTPIDDESVRVRYHFDDLPRRNEPQPPRFPQMTPHHNAGITPVDLICVKCKYNLTGATIGGACPECGTSIDETLRQHTLQPRSNGTAVTSMVLGILSLGVCGLLGPIAILCSVIAKREIKQGGYTSGSKTMATAGLIMGIISTLLTVGMIWLMVKTH